jgi:hypothetical protein
MGINSTKYEPVISAKKIDPFSPEFSGHCYVQKIALMDSKLCQIRLNPL